jgi:hypothetical protein
MPSKPERGIQVAKGDASEQRDIQNRCWQLESEPTTRPEILNTTGQSNQVQCAQPEACLRSPCPPPPCARRRRRFAIPAKCSDADQCVSDVDQEDQQCVGPRLWIEPPGVQREKEQLFCGETDDDVERLLPNLGDSPRPLHATTLWAVHEARRHGPATPDAAPRTSSPAAPSPRTRASARPRRGAQGRSGSAGRWAGSSRG